MGHWTSHAFHARVVSPHLMYEDVTVGFSDGQITFRGRPLRHWRSWALIGLLVQLVLFVAGTVAVISVLLQADQSAGLTVSLVLRLAVVVAAWALCLWLADRAMRRQIDAMRAATSERMAKVPVAEVSRARLSGRTLTIRAPFDNSNRSGNWRLKVDSHDQGESLLALLGSR